MLKAQLFSNPRLPCGLTEREPLRGFLSLAEAVGLLEEVDGVSWPVSVTEPLKYSIRQKNVDRPMDDKRKEFLSMPIHEQEMAERPKTRKTGLEKSSLAAARRPMVKKY